MQNLSGCDFFLLKNLWLGAKTPNLRFYQKKSHSRQVLAQVNILPEIFNPSEEQLSEQTQLAPILCLRLIATRTQLRNLPVFILVRLGQQQIKIINDFRIQQTQLRNLSLYIQETANLAPKPCLGNLGYGTPGSKTLPRTFEIRRS